MTKVASHKFRAKATVQDAINFQSKAEARRYQELKLLKLSGDIIFFLRQPLFDLPGGTTYRADFIIFWSDGNTTIEDVKGFETKEFILKKKQVEALYPIELQIVKYTGGKRWRS